MMDHRSGWRIACAVSLSLAALVPHARAAEPDRAVEVTFALNRLDADAAAALLRSACEKAGARCSVTPLGTRGRVPGAGMLAHVNVTATPDVLEKLGALLREKDGPATGREYRIELIEASDSDLEPMPPTSDMAAEALRAVRELLPFKHFRLLTALVFRAPGEGRLSGSDVRPDTGDRYTIEMSVAGALDAEERVFVRDFDVSRNGRSLIDSQFYVEFGKPIVVGTSGPSGRGGALLAVLTVTEGSKSPAGSGTSAVPLSPGGTVEVKLSRNSVLRGAPLRIGDLVPVSDAKAKRILDGAGADDDRWKKCLEADPRWLRRTADGTRLEMLPPRGRPPLDEVTTAYCVGGLIVIGGYERAAPDDARPAKAWIYTSRAGESGWAKTYLDRPLETGTAGAYRLEEVLAIDPVSREILFLGASASGESAHLSAPFAIVTREPSKQEAR